MESRANPSLLISLLCRESTGNANCTSPDRRSKNVGAHFVLTPRKFKSGEVDYDGRISKCGDETVRTALYEAANVLLTRSTRWSALKAWARRVARDRGLNRARVALARNLALIMHRM